MRAHGRPTPTRPRDFALLRLILARAPERTLRRFARAPEGPLGFSPLVLSSALAFIGCATHEPGSLTEVRQGECASCHADEALDTDSPPHVQAAFPNTCGDCHNEEAWDPAQNFEHTPKFALTLGHETPGCADCHTAGYEPGAIPNACVDCHADRAEAVVDPVHNGLIQDCFACHRTDAFWPAYFVHSWPLEGKHALPSCASCHPGNPATYEGTISACIGCHADDRARADAEVQGHAGFGAECQGCHTPEGF